MEIGGAARYEGRRSCQRSQCPAPSRLRKGGAETPHSFFPFARALIDVNGRYTFEIERQEALIVELIRDKCDWFGLRRSMGEDELKGKLYTLT